MAKMTTLLFKKPGLLTTVQDLGRIGVQHLGVPIGGVMDQKSAKTGNWLVGNKDASPILEITLMGPEIEIQGPCQIALTGARLSPLLNGQQVSMYETINIDKNAILSFGKLVAGCRTYLAIGGTWQVKKWLSSYSAASVNGLALTRDSIIQKNSLLMINSQAFIPKRIAPQEQQATLADQISVRVMMGPEFDLFTSKDIAHFFGQTYHISNQSNRMGYRLEESIPNFQPCKELISSATLPGTIQISNSGQPIVLMRDAQTTGGYFRIANILTEDLDKVAQLKPKNSIRFILKEF